MSIFRRQRPEGEKWKIEKLDPDETYSQEEWALILRLQEQIGTIRKLCDETKNTYIWSMVEKIAEIIMPYPISVPQATFTRKRLKENSSLLLENIIFILKNREETLMNSNWHRADDELKALVGNTFLLAQELAEKLKNDLHEKKELDEN